MSPSAHSRLATVLLLCAGLQGCAPTSRAQAPARGSTPDGFEVWAFHAPWDPRSAESAARNLNRIDVLVSGWIALDTIGGRPLVLYRDTLARPGASRARYAALVTCWLGDRFHPSTVLRLADDQAALARTAGTLASHAAEHGYDALVLDFEGHEPEQLPRLMYVAKSIADSAHARGVDEIVLCIPAVDRAYPADTLLSVVDVVLPMLYDEHWSTSGPGPVSSPAWVRASLERRVAEAGAVDVMAGLPLYGYFWRTDTAVARTVGVTEARRLAGEWGVALSRDSATRTLTARSQRGELWVTDAVLLRELLGHARALGVRRVALWRLGLEDPALWDVLRPDS